MFMSKQAPARKFSDEDWKYFDNAIIHTLKYVNDGGSHNWNNPASSASGKLEVLESTTKDNVPCRRVRLTNFYDQLKGVTEFVFCKQADGEWKVTQ
jgi:surface antigen